MTLKITILHVLTLNIKKVDKLYETLYSVSPFACGALSKPTSELTRNGGES